MFFGKSLSQRSESNCWRANGIRMENFPGFITLGILEEIKNWWKIYSVILSSSTTGSSSCQCTTTLYGENEETQKSARQNSFTVVNYARRFPRGRWSFLGPGSETYSDKPDGDWDKTAELMMINFAEKRSSNISCHLCPGKRRIKKQRKGKEVYCRFVERIIQSFRSSWENLQRMRIWKQWKFQLNFLFLILTPTRSCKETCCEIVNVNSNNFLKIRHYPNCAALLKKDMSSLHSMKNDQGKWRIYVESTHCLEVRRHPEWEGGFSETRKSARSWMWRSVFIQNVTVSKSWSNLCSRWNSFLGSNCERKTKICFRNVRNHFPWICWAQSCKGTCCKNKATTKARCDTVSHFYSCSGKKMDRHQSRESLSWVFYCVQSHDQITTTSSINSSRRWKSSTIWRYYERIQGKVRWCFAMTK